MRASKSYVLSITESDSKISYAYEKKHVLYKNLAKRHVIPMCNGYFFNVLH